MILVVDNYDSFTWNLVHLLKTGGHRVRVVRNDAMSTEEALGLEPRAIFISPGPGRPEETGICSELLERAKGVVPVLGVCLGMQVIACVFGARVVRAKRLVHGKTSLVRHRNKGVFEGLPNPLEAMRYHSLVVEKSSLPDDLEVTAWIEGESDTIMGLRHRSMAIEGIQFHPESFMTSQGAAMVKGFLDREAGAPQ